MKKIVIGCMSVLIMSGLVSACMAPFNIEGVAFTNGEEVDFSRIEDYGEEGVNYVKQVDSSRVSYLYKSRYDSNTMVYIGNYSLSYASECNANCMGVIADTGTVPAFPEEEPDTAYFDFVRAVVMELKWLSENGIVNLSRSEIETIESGLYKERNGGMQYWTCKDTPLAYNAWYEKGEEQGVWGDAEGVKTFGVEGGSGISNCSVIDPGEGTPKEALSVQATRVINTVNQSTPYCMIKSVSFQKGEVQLGFSRTPETQGRIAMYNIKGEEIAETIINADTRRVSLGLDRVNSSGIYIIRYDLSNTLGSVKVNLVD